MTSPAERAKALLELATHPGTPEEEARTSAMAFARIVKARGLDPFRGEHFPGELRPLEMMLEHERAARQRCEAALIDRDAKIAQLQRERDELHGARRARAERDRARAEAVEGPRREWGWSSITLNGEPFPVKDIKISRGRGRP